MTVNKNNTERTVLQQIEFLSYFFSFIDIVRNLLILQKIRQLLQLKFFPQPFHIHLLTTTVVLRHN